MGYFVEVFRVFRASSLRGWVLSFTTTASRGDSSFMLTVADKVLTRVLDTLEIANLVGVSKSLTTIALFWVIIVFEALNFNADVAYFLYFIYVIKIFF